jgi:hypothetical protein
LREWCLGYLRAGLAWRSGDATAYLAWARSGTHHPRARLNLLADASLIDEFLSLTAELRGARFGSWFRPDLLTRFGSVQVRTLTILSEQEERVMMDRPAIEAPPTDAATLQSRIADLAGLVPPRPPSQLLQSFALAAAVGSFAIAAGFLGRYLRRMWNL